MTQTVQALCAHCRVPVERVAEPNAENRYACPVCGNGDTHDAIISEVGEYIQEMAAKKLSDRISDIGRQSRFVSVKHTHTPRTRNWRFITNVKL